MANSYKNFKKHEQAKIVSNIQSEIISSGKKAYLVTDDFMHIMSYNKTVQNYLKDILGSSIADKLFVSYHTVKKLVQNIYSKCRLKSRFYPSYSYNTT